MTGCALLLGCASANEASGPASGSGGTATGGTGGGELAGKSGAAAAGSSAAAGGGGSGGKIASASGGSSAAAGGGGRSGAGGTGGAIAGSGGTDGAGGSGDFTHQTLYVSGYGGDITVFAFDASTGNATQSSSVSGGMSPSYMAFSPDRKHAYAINEVDGANSKVIAFSIDAATGKLTELNRGATKGNGAPHLAVHPSGKWIAVAHYNSGQVSILPVHDDGTVGDAGTVDMGPNNGCMNAHEAVFDSRGTHLLVPCLGSNYVIQYLFDSATGMLSYNNPSTVAVMGGPRHLALDPQEKYAYVVSETESLLTSFKYDADGGKLSDPQMINAYDMTKGKTAHVVVHPGGKWLYTSNRTENSIGLFSIDDMGRPHAVSFVKDMIMTPRDFSIDASGGWLISANQDGAQNILMFQIDAGDGHLTYQGMAAVGGSPTFTRALVLSP